MIRRLLVAALLAAIPGAAMAAAGLTGVNGFYQTGSPPTGTGTQPFLDYCANTGSPSSGNCEPAVVLYDPVSGLIASFNADTGLNVHVTNSSADTTLTATGTLSAADTAATSTTGTNGQTILTWASAPTTGSTLQFAAFSGAQTGLLICYGTVSATMELDTEMDTASPAHYIQQTISQLVGGGNPSKAATFTGLIMGKVNLAGAVGAQIRATAYTSGSPTCTLRLSSNLADSVIANLLPPGKDEQINITTTTTGTSLLNGVTGQTIHVSAYEFIAGGTTTFSLGYSTSTSCTSITTVAGPWPLGAQVGETFGSGVADVLTMPSGDTLCEVSTGASVAVGGHVHTTQY